MRFSRQEYWCSLPFPSPWDLPNQRIKPVSCIDRQILYHWATKEAQSYYNKSTMSKRLCLNTGDFCLSSHFFVCYSVIQYASVQFSSLVVSNSLRPHESQHASPPCPSPTPRVHSDSAHRVSDAIQPSHPLSSPSPPAPKPSQHQTISLKIAPSSWEVEITSQLL